MSLELPATLSIGGIEIYAHVVFEALAYLIGFRLYVLLRRRNGDPVDDGRRWSLVAAAILGAAAGSKLLHLLAQPADLALHWRDPGFLLGGKTIVGALLGGWICVEAAKKKLGVTRRTGDLYVLPLCVGIAMGRVGCFLTGLEDGTHGVATSLPWGVDLGDGVPRHPVVLYEILFLAALASYLVRRRPTREGDAFRRFMIGYLGFRFLIDFLKPYEAVLGIGILQWACLCGLAWYALTAHTWREVPATPVLHG